MYQKLLIATAIITIKQSTIPANHILCTFELQILKMESDCCNHISIQIFPVVIHRQSTGHFFLLIHSIFSFGCQSQQCYKGNYLTRV